MGITTSCFNKKKNASNIKWSFLVDPLKPSIII